MKLVSQSRFEPTPFQYKFECHRWTNLIVQPYWFCRNVGLLVQRNVIISSKPVTLGGIHILWFAGKEVRAFLLRTSGLGNLVMTENAAQWGTPHCIERLVLQTGVQFSLSLNSDPHKPVLDCACPFGRCKISPIAFWMHVKVRKVRIVCNYKCDTLF